MLFNSFAFLIFFPVVTTLYFLLPHKFRWQLLLASSCIFYMYLIPMYIFVLIFLILVDYFAGILIEQSSGKKRKMFLIFSILANCGVLFIFKYFHFFNSNVTAIASLIHWNYPITVLQVVLPIGLSFHTFQSMSYTIEVYRKKQKAEKHLGIYALYVMFYPQLVAGPIERPYNLIHQFYEKHQFEIKRVLEGLGLMCWGLFKKVVVADRLALLVNAVFNNPTQFTGTSLILAVIFFTFQIYCDFSGYSDIAIGAAKVMDFTLMENFNRPYLSKSLSEFWKRWHISLSTWFRDYVYIPLGGNRVLPVYMYLNLLIVFVVSGLWHGANWTFIIWGGIYGILLIFSKITFKIRKRISNIIGLNNFPNLYQVLQIIVTFLIVSFSWIFFRANSISDAFYIITHLFTNISFNANSFGAKLVLMTNDIILSLILIVFIVYMDILQEKKNKTFLGFMADKGPAARIFFYLIILFIILLFGVFKNTTFIYFQF
jgi:alginate O-acetyltransferase complex protein AlgI